MAILFWFIFTLLATANLGKYHILGSDSTIVIYGVVVFLLGHFRRVR